MRIAWPVLVAAALAASRVHAQSSTPVQPRAAEPADAGAPTAPKRDAAAGSPKADAGETKSQAACSGSGGRSSAHAADAGVAQSAAPSSPAAPRTTPAPKPAPPRAAASSPRPHPEDEAILRRLEFFMLMEMMRDYELFYDDPEPAPTK